MRDDRTHASINGGGSIEVPTDVSAGLASGYALAKYLTPTAPTLEVVEARRKDAEGRGMFDEATLWAQRANELAPSHERRAALIDAALQAMRWTVAASALLPSGVERPGADAHVLSDIDLTFVFGCRGDPRRAVLVDAVAGDTGTVDERSIAKLEKVDAADACTTLNVARPCDLCFTGESELSPEQLAEATRGMQEARAQVDAAIAAHGKLIADAKAAFPAGPFLRVRSRPASWPRVGEDGTARKKPWLAIVRFDVSEVSPSEDQLVSLAPIALPAAVEDDVVDAWVAVPADEALRFDLLFATDEAEAKALLAPVAPVAADATAPNRAHVAASWARAALNCDCGC